MEGIPVVDAQVGFISRDKEGISGIGMTDEEGNFTLRTFVKAGQNLEGAIPGEYDVTVFKPAPPSFGASRRIQHLLPEKYSKPGCGLEAIVTEEGNNEFAFDLKADDGLGKPDKHGILRDRTGRPIGVWGIDGVDHEDRSTEDGEE